METETLSPPPSTEEPTGLRCVWRCEKCGANVQTTLDDTGFTRVPMCQRCLKQGVRRYCLGVMQVLTDPAAAPMPKGVKPPQLFEDESSWGYLVSVMQLLRVRGAGGGFLKNVCTSCYHTCTGSANCLCACHPAWAFLGEMEAAIAKFHEKVARRQQRAADAKAA